MSLVFPFDPNIERASTIPARVYNDPVFLELERERIFARTWQLVGRVDDVREHGQFFTAQIENDPIVVLRDGDTLRGFYNVCLHRAGPVASGCGQRNTLQCRYHGWTYSLDGTLRRAPEMQGVQRFDPDVDAPRAGAGRDVGSARLRERGRQGAAARRRAGGSPRPARAVPLRVDALRDAQGVGDRLQLEDLRRQLPQTR